MKKISALILCALMALTISATAQVKVGETAPDFEVNHLGNKIKNLKDFYGKPIVLEWINTDCPFVRAQYDAGKMQALQSKYADQVVWLTVASSAPGKQGHYTADQWKDLLIKEKSQATHLVLDPQGTIGKRYAAKTTPHMYVIDKNGKVAYQGAIDDRKETNYVDLALQALKAGKPVNPATTQAYGCSVKYPD